ncbi:3-oxoacyl-ACP synthase [Candidatus Protofrankia californiensis]|uniref:3-oxoacyl-ACP synthase n=1 Tax=Candidatus Protofrankia californiensis TaxID=1839754 RepID=A0A1C3P0X4_9ACTN|nr:3-oxoacyl-ACP synthase [Candidatus Protofrankia californiensis]
MVCSGYVYGCIAAAGMLLAGGASGPRNSRDHALAVGADAYSRIMNRADRKTVSLFGDGAGATVLGPVPDGYGIIGYSLTCDGGLAGLVEVPAGGTRLPLSENVYRRKEHLFRMDGRAVKEYAMTAVPKMIDECAGMAGVSLDEVDRVILHQGNVRLVETLAQHMGFDPSRVEISADKYGNTAAASVPMTLALSHQRKLLQRDEVVLLACVGGGMTAGAVMIRWY